jgi:hypothetical protein
MFAVRAKHAGVRPPVSRPEFELRRGAPLWTPNFRSGINPENDPIGPTSTADSRIYHYQTDGNAYLEQPFDAEMAFEPAATGLHASADVFAFKCLVKPHEINGRRLLYSNKGEGVASGGIFVDILDGKLRLGWYDTVLKKEVWIETSVPVFDPHHWHYVYVRKRYPSKSLGSGCWRDTIFGLTTSQLNDVMLVRRFRKTDASFYQRRTWDYKRHASVRQFIGFTTDLDFSVGGSAGTGLVSHNGLTYTGDIVGNITASGACFSRDMLGMLFCPGNGPFAGQSFVIDAFTSSTIVTVVDPITGVAVDLTTLVNDLGGVYTGVKLIKSDGFADSENVDQSTYATNLFGSHLALDASSGVMPFVGEFASFAYIVESGATPNLFEPSNTNLAGGLSADLADDGCDLFNDFEIFQSSTVGPGELHAHEVARDSFTAVDTQPLAGDDQASTKPNETMRIAPEAAPSSARVTPLTWRFLRERGEMVQKIRVRCAFYDPEQAQVSAPGPELEIDPGGDDASNTSSKVEIKLTELPAPVDRGEIETWVYATLPGTFSFFKVAEVPKGATSTSFSPTLDELARGLPLEFDNWPPPECSVLEVSQSSLVCGNLRRWVNSDEGNPTDFPDVAVFSKPNRPLAFPAENIIAVPDSSREGVTGLRDFNGRLLITKRDTIHRAALRQGAAQSEVVSKTFGCSSGQSLIEHEGVLMFWGKRGVYAYDGSGIPRWIGANVRELFETGIEPGAALESVAGVNPRRNQVVFTLREVDALYKSHRLSVEPFGGGLRFSRYEAPNLTALVDHATDDGEVGEFAGGTEEGFFVWLDRQDSSLVMLGAAATHGASSLTVGVGSTTTQIVVSGGTLDLALAGPRGAVASWGNERLMALAVEAGNLLLDRPASAPPAQGTTIRLGVAPRYWETRWLDFEDSESVKRARYLDVTTKLGTGALRVSAFLDFGTTARSLIPHNSNPPPSEINLATRAVTRFDIGHLNARHFKFRFEADVPFEIIELVFRVSDVDPT